MKIITVFAVLISMLVVTCGEKENKNLMEHDFSEEMSKSAHVVQVEERMDAGTYSYLLVSENDKSYWIAIPKSDIGEGDIVHFSQYMEMKDFRSETLDRTFKSVLFVEDARKNDLPPTDNPHQMQLGSIPKEDVKIEKVKDGFTIEELYSKKNELSTKIVKVRGKVVKANLGIMNKNWYHIQDGTGTKGTHDLTVTSDDNAEIGDVVLIEGRLIKDKDYGSGYTYALILEDSKIKVE